MNEYKLRLTTNEITYEIPTRNEHLGDIIHEMKYSYDNLDELYTMLKNITIISANPNTNESGQLESIELIIVYNEYGNKSSVENVQIQDHSGINQRLFDVAMENPLYNQLFNEMKSIANVIEKPPQPSMLGFYESGRGLFWMDYPSRINGSFRVHFRKLDYGDEVRQLPNYKEKGWGDYPTIKVERESDVQIAICMVKSSMGSNKRKGLPIGNIPEESTIKQNDIDHIINDKVTITNRISPFKSTDQYMPEYDDLLCGIYYSRLLLMMTGHTLKEIMNVCDAPHDMVTRMANWLKHYELLYSWDKKTGVATITKKGAELLSKEGLIDTVGDENAK